MDKANQVENLDEAVCISLCANVLRKDMNPSLLPAKCKMVRQTGFRKATSQEGKTKFKTWGVLFGESMVHWCTGLLLSAHSKNLAGLTQKLQPQ